MSMYVSVLINVFRMDR